MLQGRSKEFPPEFLSHSSDSTFLSFEFSLSPFPIPCFLSFYSKFCFFFFVLNFISMPVIMLFPFFNPCCSFFFRIFLLPTVYRVIPYNISRLFRIPHYLFFFSSYF